MNLEHLTDVHTGRYAEGVEHDVKRCAVGQEGHILNGKYARNNALVAVATRHFVAYADLALEREINANDLVYAGLQLVAAVGAGEYLNVHDRALLAVGNAQRGISYLSRLFAEDGAQQSFLCGQLGLALGGYLADEDVARLDLGTDLDDTVLVKVFEHILAHVGDVAGDLFGAELGVSRLGVVFFDMDRCVNIVANDFFVKQNGVLVVVALPGHEADESVFAESDLAVIGSGAVREHLALLYALTA